MHRVTVLASLAIAATSALAGPPEPPASTLSVAKAETLVADQLKDIPEPEFTIGDKAPKVEPAGWVQGARSHVIEKNKVTVFECWATWCGPCIRQIPHLNKLYKEYEKKGVNFVGVAVWQREQNVGETVTAFVEDKGDEMSYPVAWDEGKIAKLILEPSETRGIPAAFIFDKKGNLAWTGHPASMDEPLEKITAGDWDLDEAKAQYLEDRAGEALYMNVMRGLMKEDSADEAYRLADALVMTKWADDPGLLNSIAWGTLTSSRLPVKNIEFSLRAAHQAAEASEWKDASIIDTLARAWWDQGDKAAGLELQKQAVAIETDPQAKSQLEKTLKEYQAAFDG